MARPAHLMMAWYWLNRPEACRVHWSAVHIAETEHMHLLSMPIQGLVAFRGSRHLVNIILAVVLSDISAFPMVQHLCSATLTHDVS